MDCVEKYRNRMPARFHTPGHQGAFSGGIFSGASYDITELPFSDNLLCPSGVIAQSEKQAAEFYGASGTLFFTNGVTSAIFTAVASAAALANGNGFTGKFNAGKHTEKSGAESRKKRLKILVGANAHKSIFNAAAVCGMCPVFFETRRDNYGYALPPAVADIERAIKNLDRAGDESLAAVVVTSPDYFGRCADLKGIYALLKPRGILLIADGAHGAHFAFGSMLPSHAAGYADFAADGCHKTMPVYTGGAMLHCYGEKTLRAAEFYRAVFHSTSPNYTVLASIDYAAARMAEDGEAAYGALYGRAVKLKTLAASFGYAPREENERGAEAEKDFLYYCENRRGAERDFSRFMVDFSPRTAAEFRTELERRNVYAEMYTKSLAVFILSPYNLSAIDRLEDALKEIKDGEKKKLFPANSERVNADKREEFPAGSERVNAGKRNIFPTGSEFAGADKKEEFSKNPECAEEREKNVFSVNITHSNATENNIFTDNGTVAEQRVKDLDRCGFFDFSETEFVGLETCGGRISASEIGAYPPGIPSVARGCLITPGILEYLLENKSGLFGLVGGKVAVFKTMKKSDGQGGTEP